MSDLQDFLKRSREELFNGNDRKLYLHIGFFVAWFSAAEIRLTMLLAMATKSANFEAFELLTRGMDARVKIDRLRRACDAFNLTIGPNLARRLEAFEKTILPIRNKIAHSFVTTDKTYEVVHFASMSRLPYAAYGIAHAGKAPENIDFLDLFQHGLWLSFLNKDLQSAMKRGFRSETLEIDHPLSPLPPAKDQDSSQPKQRASAGRRERKRERKGQKTRRS